MMLPVEGIVGTMSPSDTRWASRRVRTWFGRHGREFPWRQTSDPFHILIAELLLQRTRADLVPDAFTRFIGRYPDPASLAVADESDVVDLLRPLGFLHRSARLPHLARELCGRFEGRVPRTEAELASLPGVGRYVANAVLVVAYGARRPLLDPNVIRLLARCFGISSSRARPRDDDRLWRLVEDIVPSRDPKPVALGLIDLGAVVCRPKRPTCHICPLRLRCRALRTGLVVPCE
jgi:A/G-specific adenine glycosylase